MPQYLQQTQVESWEPIKENNTEAEHKAKRRSASPTVVGN